MLSWNQLVQRRRVALRPLHDRGNSVQIHGRMAHDVVLANSVL